MGQSRSDYANTLPFSEIFKGASGHSLLPGGFGRSTFALAPRTPMAVRGAGYHVCDEAGRQLIDLNNNFTAHVHGNAHPDIVAAGYKAMCNGSAFGMPNMLEIDHAQLLLERLPYVDQVRYTCSGTEAVMLALRVARATTRRDKVVFVRHAYHGHSDAALATGGPHTRRGVPDGVTSDIIDVAINDSQALTDVFDRHPAQIAAVVIDPMPNRAGLVEVGEPFWKAARMLCTETDTVLVSDEVIALRLGYEGAAMALGVAPDVIVMGEIIGGGMPVGAVAGIEKVMSVLDPLRGGLEHAGTFSANPVTMAAGIVALQLLPQFEVDRLNALGGRLRSALARGVDDHGWDVRGGGSLVCPYPREVSRDEARTAHAALWWEAYDRGVLLTQTGLGSLSTPMNDALVDDIADRLIDAVAATKMAVAA